MKMLLSLLFLISINSALASHVYDCTNSKIDEDLTYYKQNYLVKLDVASKTAKITDSESTLSIKLTPSAAATGRSAGGLSGTQWCDGGCCVEVMFDAAMVSGEVRGKMRVDQELECQAPPAWLKCNRKL